MQPGDLISAWMMCFSYSHHNIQLLFNYHLESGKRSSGAAFDGIVVSGWLLCISQLHKAYSALDVRCVVCAVWWPLLMTMKVFHASTESVL